MEPEEKDIYPSGLIDAKTSSVMEVKEKLAKEEPFVRARLGPSNDLQPTFCWSNLHEEYAHFGQPDCFNYSWTAFPAHK